MMGFSNSWICPSDVDSIQTDFGAVGIGILMGVGFLNEKQAGGAAKTWASGRGVQSGSGGMDKVGA